MSGFVTLVGAGPGHPDYLTLKGLRALVQADVVVYDALLDESFQEFFPRHAECVYVGKRCGQHHLTQEEINVLLVEKAREGKHVVRLKGGDPFVFGRGGEECLALQAADVAFDVVPGVSALNAAGGLAGVPLTHRHVAQRLLFLECHPHSLDRHDWLQLAAFDGTIAVFMGTRSIPEIASRLIAHGKSEVTPMVLVENAGLENQRVARTQLSEAAAGRLTSQTEGPGMIYIGEVAALDFRSGQAAPTDIIPESFVMTLNLDNTPNVQPQVRPHRRSA